MYSCFCVGSRSGSIAPISLPGSLYGQSTVLKSIQIVYRSLDPTDGVIAHTRLVESIDPWTSNVLVDDDKPHTSSQMYPLHHYLGKSGGFLTLELTYDFLTAEGIPGVDIYGIKVRVGHK